MKTRNCLSLLPVACVLALVACHSTPQMTNRPDFLSTYDHLHKVDATTWRYISPPLLANCNQFVVSPVRIMFTDAEGKPLTDEQRQRASEFVRQTIAKAISERYPIVPDTGVGVGEIRVAVTEAYRTGGRLGLCVQGEILDNSHTQAAAVVRTELSEHYMMDWQDQPKAREMVEEWAQRLRVIIDEAHTH